MLSCCALSHGCLEPRGHSGCSSQIRSVDYWIKVPLKLGTVIERVWLCHAETLIFNPWEYKQSSSVYQHFLASRSQANSGNAVLGFQEQDAVVLKFSYLKYLPWGGSDQLDSTVWQSFQTRPPCHLSVISSRSITFPKQKYTLGLESEGDVFPLDTFS